VLEDRTSIVFLDCIKLRFRIPTARATMITHIKSECIPIGCNLYLASCIHIHRPSCSMCQHQACRFGSPLVPMIVNFSVTEVYQRFTVYQAVPINLTYLSCSDVSEFRSLKYAFSRPVISYPRRTPASLLGFTLCNSSCYVIT
jgi:hypothetical protein